MKKTERRGLTLEKAEKIMGRLIISIDEVDKLFSLIPCLRPIIPFTERELEIHTSRGHRLYLELSHADNGQPLNIEAIVKMACRKKGNQIGPNEYLFWSNQFSNDGVIKPEAWFCGDQLARSAMLELGWRIASEEVIPETLNRDYIGQIGALIRYNKEVYKDFLPEHYKQAIVQWDEKEPILKKMLWDKNKQALCQEFAKTKINSLVREPYLSTIYRYALMHKAEKRKILQGHWSQSSTASLSGDFISFGHAVDSGAMILYDGPILEWPYHGAIFSRSGNIED